MLFNYRLWALDCFLWIMNYATLINWIRRRNLIWAKSIEFLRFEIIFLFIYLVSN